MNAIINAKNAFALLFLIPILTSAISFIMPSDINYKIPTATYLCCYLISGISCLYLACSKNEFIVTKKQKASMYILAIYYLILNGLIGRFLSLISENYTLYNMVSNVCEDEAIKITLTTLIYAFFGLIYCIGFLMFIWGISTKKSYRWLLTLIFFIPGIVDIICPLLASTIENIIEYRYMIVQTFDIACWGLMFYITLKAYKIINITE